jgi:hypothetical protein
MCKHLKKFILAKVRLVRGNRTNVYTLVAVREGIIEAINNLLLVNSSCTAQRTPSPKLLRENDLQIDC